MSSVEAIRGSSPDTVTPIEPVRPNILPLKKILTEAPENEDYFSSLTQISLWDSLFNAANEISKITSKDPKHRKAVEVILTDGKDIIESGPFLYSDGQLIKPVNVTSEQWVLGLVRSSNHGSVTTNDIIPLLGDPTRRDMSTSFVLLTNPVEKQLYVRTNETPSLDKYGLMEVKQKWNEGQGSGVNSLFRGKKIIDKFVSEYNIAKFSGPANSSMMSKVMPR